MKERLKTFIQKEQSHKSRIDKERTKGYGQDTSLIGLGITWHTCMVGEGKNLEFMHDGWGTSSLQFLSKKT